MANFNKPRFGSRPGGGGGNSSKNQSRPNNNRGPGGPNRGPNRGKPSGKPRRPPSALAPSRPIDPDDTGRESDYFKKLVDNEKAVVVVMSDGEKISGTIRYYDREVFSLGPADGSTKRFLRKSSIRYLYEE
jgi:hypothetical protein